MKWICAAAAVMALIGMVATPALADSKADAAQFEAERKQADYWRTDRAKFLDSAEVRDFIGRLPLQKALESDKPKKSHQEVAADIVKLLMAELATERGVHIETALTALGAMAGFAVQMGLREGPVATGKVSEEDTFVVVDTKDGRRFYTGDLIKEGLLSPRAGQHSVWGFAASTADNMGKQLPDISEIFARSAATLGSAKFGVPNLPKKHRPHVKAEVLLNKYWNVIRNSLVIERQRPLFWPFAIGLASRQLIQAGKDVIDPSLAARIVMEAAVPMSKLDPETVYRGYLLRSD